MPEETTQMQNRAIVLAGTPEAGEGETVTPNETKKINWDKQLVVVFGDEVNKSVTQLADMENRTTHEFPEHKFTHPWRHVEYLEMTTALLNRNPEIKITIVTNSPYILDHLTNLMHGAKVKADAKYTRTSDPGAFIPKKKVGVYECTHGKIVNAMPKQGEIIKWNSVSKVAEWLTNTYFEMNP